MFINIATILIAVVVFKRVLLFAYRNDVVVFPQNLGPTTTTTDDEASFLLIFLLRQEHRP